MLEENIDWQKSWEVELLAIYTLVLQEQTNFVGINIKTNEEVAIKLVKSIRNFLGAQENKVPSA